MPFSVGLVRRALATKPTFKTRYKFVPLPLDFLPHVLVVYLIKIVLLDYYNCLTPLYYLDSDESNPDVGNRSAKRGNSIETRSVAMASKRDAWQQPTRSCWQYPTEPVAKREKRIKIVHCQQLRSSLSRSASSMPTSFSGVSIVIIFDFRQVSGSRFAMAQVRPLKRHREQLTTTLNDRTISLFPFLWFYAVSAVGAGAARAPRISA
jgi:hypothetical protein